MLTPLSRAVITTLLLVVRPAPLAATRPTPPPTATPVAFVAFRPYKQAVQESRRTGRPLLLLFTNPHCVPCYWLEAEIFCKRDSADLINRLYVPVRFTRKLGPGDRTPETAEATRVAKQYGVNATPLLLAVSPSGRSIGSVAWLGRNEVLYRLEAWAKPPTPKAATMRGLTPACSGLASLAADARR